MKNMTLVLSLIALAAIVASPAARAGDADASKALDPQSSLEALKSLAGEWAGTSVTTAADGKGEPTSSPTSISYRVVGNESTVVATYRPGSRMEMLTIYHLNGPEELMLTHYCALQNQPQMKFAPSDEAGLIKFEFAGGTNFDPAKDPHAHAGSLKIIDANTIETTSVGYADGKPANFRKATLKRVK